MGERKHYFGNLMVTSRELFDEYCRWLFSIFKELEQRIDVSTYDEYHRRVFGFLSEQMLLVWITARGLKVYESRVGISEEKRKQKNLSWQLDNCLRWDRLRRPDRCFMRS